MKPLHLYRHWCNAAGMVFNRFVPSGPFSEWGALPAVLRLPSGPHADEFAQSLAAALVQSPQFETVQTGQAAYILDLPGYLSVAIGAYLQLDAVNPVSLIAGFYQPTAVLNGQMTLENLIYYGERLERADQTVRGAAFLLERERIPESGVDSFSLLKSFDNRYKGTLYFPPFEFLHASGIKALIDVRAADDAVAPDLYYFYEEAAQNDFDVFSNILPITLNSPNEWLPI